MKKESTEYKSDMINNIFGIARETEKMRKKEMSIRGKVKGRFNTIFNEIIDGEKLTINREYTIRDGSVYKWKTNNIILPPRNIIRDETCVDCILENAREEYKDNFERLVEFSRDYTVFLEPNESEIIKVPVKDIPNDYILMDCDIYNLKCVIVNDSLVRIIISCDSCNEKKSFEIRRSTNLSYNEISHHYEYIIQYFEDTMEKKVNRIEKLSEIVDYIDNEFNCLLAPKMI